MEKELIIRERDIQRQIEEKKLEKLGVIKGTRK